jgi:hypothetical protein
MGEVITQLQAAQGAFQEAPVGQLQEEYRNTDITAAMAKIATGVATVRNICGTLDTCTGAAEAVREKSLDGTTGIRTALGRDASDPPVLLSQALGLGDKLATDSDTSANGLDLMRSILGDLVNRFSGYQEKASKYHILHGAVGALVRDMPQRQTKAADKVGEYLQPL